MPLRKRVIAPRAGAQCKTAPFDVLSLDALPLPAYETDMAGL
ncbi:hypothetical protein RGAI101_2624 [Roseobacter sp. GAI101]|nr:hypothetical protein RGAI101_2624 [Roseobacter sp. GAI101]